jgi:hypothetical protein
LFGADWGGFIPQPFFFFFFFFGFRFGFGIFCTGIIFVHACAYVFEFISSSPGIAIVA